MALSEKRLEVGVSADRKDNRGGLRISDETTVLVNYWFREKLTPEQVMASLERHVRSKSRRAAYAVQMQGNP